MVELISKISKGTIMDQIYIPKERLPGFELGTAVLIKPVMEKAKPRAYYYNVKGIEPIKNAIIEDILNSFDQFENIIITGSFLDNGFEFKDIDALLITDKKIDTGKLERYFKAHSGLNLHLAAISYKTLFAGLSTDPLFQMMLSKFVSKERFIPKTRNKINYKILDLHLLKSKTLLDNFDLLTGNEKYKLTRNLVAIKMFIENEKISTEAINSKIKKYFGIDSDKIKKNMAKRDFLKKYKIIYESLLKKILNGIKNESQQK